MGSPGLMFALFVVGYLLGVWAACVVLRQGQKEYEDETLLPASVRIHSQGRR